MSSFSRRPSNRKLLALVVGAGLMTAGAPGSAIAGGDKPPSKPSTTTTTCDPAVQFCGTGRKNG